MLLSVSGSWTDTWQVDLTVGESGHMCTHTRKPERLPEPDTGIALWGLLLSTHVWDSLAQLRKAWSRLLYPWLEAAKVLLLMIVALGSMERNQAAKTVKPSLENTISVVSTDPSTHLSGG